jgi:hypothetical protein
MDDALINRIYENVKSNAIRYWHRIWLTNKLYHDKELIKKVNEGKPHAVPAFINMRESVLDSAVISLSRGFLDNGDDSLSLTRLLPSTSDHPRTRKPDRLGEEEEACSILYRRWYEGHETDGNFMTVWLHLSERLQAFRDSEEVQRTIDMRNSMVAHSLEERLGQPPDFSMLYNIRDDLVTIMNDTSGLFEHRAHEWSVFVSECESSAIGFQKVLMSGF